MIRDSRGYFGREGAEALAVQALAYLASDPEALGRFLAVTGLGPENLRRAAAAPGFLLAILDHFLADEPLLLAFAANSRLGPEEIPRARRLLAGEAA